MATWVRGVDFKNSTNTKRIGGIGIYGTDATTSKLYIGLGAEPWNSAGLQLTSSAINFKGNKIYHAGDKPTLSELGAAASSHTHSYLPLSGGTLTGETVFNNYLSLNAWSGYGSGKAQLWYNGTNKQLVIQPTAVTDIIVNNNKVYHTGNKPTPAEIGAAASSHTHNYAGSSSAGGAATTALTSNYLGSNTRMEYGWNGVNYFNISGTAGNAAKANDTPSTAWWHIMRFNHANSTGYYTDLAIPFNDTSLHYKRITAGSVQNGGWIRVLDALNYNSYAPTKTGSGASGTWGISVTGSSASCTGNAATATKLQTTRTINGTNFDGTAAITTANWGTARTITIGNTGKSVNGSGNVSWSLSEIGAAAASHTHSYAATSHNHGLLHDNFTVTLANTTTDSGWSMINSSYNGFLLKSIRTQASTPNWIVNNYGAGIAFGGSDTKGVISAAYNTPLIKFAGGNSTKPVWWIGLTGTSGTTYNLASFSTTSHNHDGVYMKQANANGYYGMTANGDASNWVRTTNSGIIPYASGGASSLGTSSWPFNNIYANNIYDNGTLLENKFAAASHSHSYLPLSGGTITSSDFAVKTTTTSDSSKYITFYDTSGVRRALMSTDAGSGGFKIHTYNSSGTWISNFVIQEDGSVHIGNGYLKAIEEIWGRSSSVNINIKKGTGYQGGAKFNWTGATNIGGPRFQMIPMDKNDLRVGSPEDPIHVVYGRVGYVTTSDKNAKTNICYINNLDKTKECNPANFSTESLTKEDFYNFFKDEIKFASYDFKEANLDNLETNLGFMAQDIANTKVGSKIVIPPREVVEYHNEDGTIDEEKVENGMYSYSTTNFAASMAIALQKAIEKIEALEEEIKLLKQ